MSCNNIGKINVEVNGTAGLTVTLLAEWKTTSPPTNVKFDDVYLNGLIGARNGNPKFGETPLEGIQNIYLNGSVKKINLNALIESKVYLVGTLC